MPELPEVETIRRHLAPHVEGRTLDAVEILDARWCRPLAPAEVEAGLRGRGGGRLPRRGKPRVGERGDELSLLMPLLRRGPLLLAPPQPPRHARVRLRLG